MWNGRLWRCGMVECEIASFLILHRLADHSTFHILKYSSSERQFEHWINLKVVHELRDVVVGVLADNLAQVALSVGINRGSTLELGSKLETHAKTLLGDKTAKTKAYVWTEVLHFDAAAHVAVLVDRNLVVANLNAIALACGYFLRELVAVTCMLIRSPPPKEKPPVTKNELELPKG